MKLKNIILSTALLVGFCACDDLFEPAIENHKTVEDLENMPAWAVGLLGHAYISNPLGENANSWKFTDVATDDAVSNDVGNGYLRMATGAWRADNNPVDSWQYLRASWQYLNQFLEISDKVEYMLATESDSINVNTADDLIMQTYDTIAKASENKGSIPGQATGFDNIDLKMGGIDGLAVLGARPGMGKTAFALNVAEHIVYNELKPVVFFSLEMGAQQLMLRLVSSMTRIKYSALRYGELEDDDWTKLASFMNQSEKTKKLLICDEPKMTVRKIRSVCRRLKKQYGSLGAVIVDYLQLIEMPNNKNCTKAQAVGDVSRELKILTKELGCPIIALSQLNRANEQRSDKRPTLADLRDSGAIEQDADSVMFIHNEDAYRKDKSQPPTGKVEILLPKSRFSQTGTMFLKFQPEYMKFSNWNVKKDPFNRSKNSAAVWDKPDENDKENAKTGEAEKEEK